VREQVVADAVWKNVPNHQERKGGLWLKRNNGQKVPSKGGISLFRAFVGVFDELF
jgi:hypothetical protein